jgi:hypothetical protein
VLRFRFGVQFWDGGSGGGDGIVGVVIVDGGQCNPIVLNTAFVPSQSAQGMRETSFTLGSPR